VGFAGRFVSNVITISACTASSVIVRGACMRFVIQRGEPMHVKLAPLGHRRSGGAHSPLHHGIRFIAHAGTFGLKRRTHG
jgi:hypothetical protein